MVLLLQYFGLAFSALLPVVNPLGSALVLLGLVGPAPDAVFRKLAQEIALRTVLFLLVVELVGAAILGFFGISLPVVQLSGGLAPRGHGMGLAEREKLWSKQRTDRCRCKRGLSRGKGVLPIYLPRHGGAGVHRGDAYSERARGQEPDSRMGCGKRTGTCRASWQESLL